jgi:uncharacterized protein
VAGTLASGVERPWPYGPLGGAAGGPATPVEVALTAYHDWANRGPSTMRVWLPVMPVA